MKKVIWYALLIVEFVAGYLALPSNHAYAINPPSSPGQSIIRVDAYKDLADGAQLYLVDYNIPYSTYPTDYTASQTFLIHLVDSATGTEFGVTAPFTNPYFNNGFGEGVAGLYFSASDVAIMGMVWNSANYTIVFDRNPAITWNGTPPAPYVFTGITYYNVTTFLGISSASSSDALKARILNYAGYFQSKWGLTFSLQTSNVLTNFGDNYFSGAIPNLRTICPQVFSGYLVPLAYHRRAALSVTYALTLRNQWVASWLDLSQAALDWNLDAIWLYAGMWLLVTFAAVWGVAALARSNRGIFYTILMCIGVGGLVGFLPWSALGLSVLVAGFVIVNETFWKRSVQ